jgi:shikimate dehydrogenase
MIGDALQLAVIGAPIRHSLSPQLWAELLALTDRRGEMVPLEVLPDALAATLDDVRGGRFHGLSVTLPHKERALALADVVEPGAERVGAANCIVRRGDQLLAANTDVDGVRLAVAQSTLLRHPPHTAVVLGAGGAARAGVVALLDLGVHDIVVANRTPARAEALVVSIGDGRVRAAPLTADGLQVPLDAAELLVNATAVGLNAPEDDPLPAALALGPHHVVLDMVYRPRATALLRRAAAASAEVIDGLWMLAGQALAAFARFTDAVAPDVLQPLHEHLVDVLDAPDAASDDLDFLAARAAIDRADTAVVELLGHRFRAADVIGRIKARRGEPVVRPEREQALRARLTALGAAQRLPAGLIDEVYAPILTASRAAQAALQAGDDHPSVDDDTPS